METCEDGNDLVFFYRVCEGVANASHASHTAAQARLPDKLIARGKEVMRFMPTPSIRAPSPLLLLMGRVPGPMAFLLFLPNPHPAPPPCS